MPWIINGTVIPPEFGIERLRQAAEEGASDVKDDLTTGQLREAALCYFNHAAHPDKLLMKQIVRNGKLVEIPYSWPWSTDWWKPKTKRRDLERAGALFMAERDRLHRSGLLGNDNYYIETYLVECARAYKQLAIHEKMTEQANG